MNTSTPNDPPDAPQAPAFAVWLTGLPASGKSTITRALVAALGSRGIRPAVLESDELRKVLTPAPTYSPQERDQFYNAMVHIGTLLAAHGVPVIFDATANRRAYRDAARAKLPRFVEVHVTTPREVCERRDPKGIYRGAGRAAAGSVPGVQSPYEPPAAAEATVSGAGDPAAAALAIVAAIEGRGWLGTVRNG